MTLAYDSHFWHGFLPSVDRLSPKYQSSLKANSGWQVITYGTDWQRAETSTFPVLFSPSSRCPNTDARRKPTGNQKGPQS